MPPQVVTKTAILKLHNPSQRKRAILDQALRAYTDAYRELLVCAKERLDELIANCSYVDKRGKTRLSDRKLAVCLTGIRSEPLSSLSSVLRESVRLDVAGNLLSYVALKATDDRTQYPEGRSTTPQDEYDRTLRELQEGTIAIETKDDYDLWRDRLTRVADYRPQPIYYCRVRDFNLRKLENEKWGVDLKLLPKGNPRGATRLHVPLAFGEWHKDFFEKGKPRAAFLVNRDGEYYIHVAFEFQVTIGATETLLGIDRGVLKRVAFAVLTSQGTLLALSSGGRDVRQLQIERGKTVQDRQSKGRSISRRHYKQKAIDQRIHILANEIVKLAAEQKSQVVMEDLDIQTGGKFTRSDFAKLGHFLSYKLPLAGLPPPRTVFAAYSSVICSRCGADGTRDADNREVFRCPACGTIMDADENAAVNIARRILYRKSEWETRGGYRAFHKSFAVHSERIDGLTV